MARPLTPRQARFVAEYLKDLNATQAAIRAGYSKHTADVQGPRLLGNVGVAESIAAGQARYAKKAEMDADEWRAAVARLARADVRALFDPETGNLLPINEMSDEASACVAAIEVLRERHIDPEGGEGAVTESVVKVKLWDKIRALEMVGRHLGLLKDQVEVSGSLDIASRLVAARRRTGG